MQTIEKMSIKTRLRKTIKIAELEIFDFFNKKKFDERKIIFFFETFCFFQKKIYTFVFVGQAAEQVLSQTKIEFLKLM